MLHKRGLGLDQEYPPYGGDNTDCKEGAEGELLLLQEPYDRPEQLQYYQSEKNIIDKGDDGITRRVQYMEERVIEDEAAGNEKQERGNDVEQDVKIKKQFSNDRSKIYFPLIHDTIIAGLRRKFNPLQIMSHIEKSASIRENQWLHAIFRFMKDEVSCYY